MPKGSIYPLFILRHVSRFIISTLARRNKKAKIKGSKVSSMRSVLCLRKTPLLDFRDSGFSDISTNRLGFRAFACIIEVTELKPLPDIYEEQISKCSLLKMFSSHVTKYV
jgi:hypothetical protein